MAPANANGGTTQKIQVSANDKPVKDSEGVPALNATDAKPTSKLSELDIAELKIAEKFAGADRYIPFSATPWFPWVGELELKCFRFENRTGTFVIGVANRTDHECYLGKHRHRGQVTAHTLCGEWHYKEYDWVARPGDYVVESPGTIHTLVMGPNTQVIFTVTSSIEFFTDDDSLKSIMDGVSFFHLYNRYCEEKGIKPDESLWF